ncbi:response regulator [Limnoglobus roseus]|uniref:Response regulator n=1 Tax=Limnoglobus roseus TaxID=2598579 RepID=A0A5C1APU1_9BACT|nr:response regulator [Limnoglobus roseus]QEL19244.1 response regulator [Limnoglobus roseus]
MTDPVPLSVLIIDDDRNAADSLAACLTLHGYAVRTAASAAAAIALAVEARPEVVLLDLHTPGMDGWELAANLAASNYRPVTEAAAGADPLGVAWVHIPFHLGKQVDTAVVLDVLARAARTREARRRMNSPP